MQALRKSTNRSALRNTNLLETTGLALVLRKARSLLPKCTVNRETSDIRADTSTMVQIAELQIANSVDRALCLLRGMKSNTIFIFKILVVIFHG